MEMRLTAALFGALAGAMLVYPLEAAAAARHALSLFAVSVAPVLGPFMACMLMMTSRFRGGMGVRVGLGWLCGSPGGAKIMLLTSPRGKAALRCAAVTGTMSPMFFLGAMAGWLQSRRNGALILLCHIAGAALLGMMLPKGEGGEACHPVPMQLGAAIRESGQALLSIALCMMLGCTAAKMMQCAFPDLPEAAAIFFQCALEVTAGAERIALLDTPWKLPLLCGACSFGGLSLLMQNVAVWQEAGIKMGALIWLRLCHGGISFLLCALLLQILPI